MLLKVFLFPLLRHFVLPLEILQQDHPSVFSLPASLPACLPTCLKGKL